MPDPQKNVHEVGGRLPRKLKQTLLGRLRGRMVCQLSWRSTRIVALTRAGRFIYISAGRMSPRRLRIYHTLELLSRREQLAFAEVSNLPKKTLTEA